MSVLFCLLFSFLIVFAEGYKQAVDVETSLTSDQLRCLQSNYSIQAVIVRAYKPDNNGTFDNNCVSTINLSRKASLSVEIFMTINPTTWKQGYDQVDELQKQLKKNSLSFRRVWVKVTSDMKWATDVIYNQGMISQVLGRLRQFGYAVGILTNKQDWTMITNSWNQAGSDVNLWYSNVDGYGVSGETAANFNDYQSFGITNSPIMKQYGMEETLCNVLVNRDCF